MRNKQFLAICPSTNKKGKHDVTGAFLPEARAFQRQFGGYLNQFDNKLFKWRRRRQVEKLIKSHSGLKHIAIFCHGHKRGLQTGHTLGTAKNLAKTILGASAPGVNVVLFCCDTGRDLDSDRRDDRRPGPGGEGGFADRLRDEMLNLGMDGSKVYAHAVRAHTTKAPYVRVFHVEENAVGGEFLVSPLDPRWNEWKGLLQDNQIFRVSMGVSDDNIVGGAMESWLYGWDDEEIPF